MESVHDNITDNIPPPFHLLLQFWAQLCALYLIAIPNGEAHVASPLFV
jgi:hypothetical protein